MRTLVTTITLAALALACAEPKEKSAGKAGAPAEVEATDPNGPKRPTEESEGVPGYLTDPARVRVQLDPASGHLAISAPAGTVAASSGSPRDVRVQIWTVERGAELSATKPSPDAVRLDRVDHAPGVDELGREVGADQPG